jgi:hypothetical protein
VGNAFFGALPVGNALFLQGETMRKKITNEQIGKCVSELADKVRSEMDLEFRVKQGQVWQAEKALVESLNPEQLALYNDYSEKLDAFYAIAEELYIRRF